MLIESGSAAAAKLCAERYRAGVEAMQLRHDASPLRFLSVSMGVAQLDQRTHRTAEQWLEQAYTALYGAKGSGRNRVVGEQAKAA